MRVHAQRINTCFARLFKLKARNCVHCFELTIILLTPFYICIVLFYHFLRGMSGLILGYVLALSNGSFDKDVTGRTVYYYILVLLTLVIR